MKTKAIIFDKDGTLMDFDAFWVTISRISLADILSQMGREDIDADEILRTLGVENGVTDISSIFAYGSFHQVGEVIHRHLLSKGCVCELEWLVEQIIQRFHANTDRGIISPACRELPALLAGLRAMGLRLAVATTDDPYTTGKCLQALGIEECFEVIYSDDGFWPVKPDPCCIRDLCRRLSLSPDEIVMVGDSVNDMRFARNGGIKAIGVAKTPANRRTLTQYADAVIHDISQILTVID